MLEATIWFLLQTVVQQQVKGADKIHAKIVENARAIDGSDRKRDLRTAQSVLEAVEAGHSKLTSKQRTSIVQLLGKKLNSSLDQQTKGVMVLTISKLGPEARAATSDLKKYLDYLEAEKANTSYPNPQSGIPVKDFVRDLIKQGENRN